MANEKGGFVYQHEVLDGGGETKRGRDEREEGRGGGMTSPGGGGRERERGENEE